MKLSRRMRQTISQIPDFGESAAQGRMSVMYASELDPLVKRGLVEYEMRRVMIEVIHPIARLTDLGRQVKMQNSDD